MAKQMAQGTQMSPPDSSRSENGAATAPGFAARRYVIRLAARLWCSLLLMGMFLQWLDPLEMMGGEDGRLYYGLLVVLTAVLLFVGSIGLPLWMMAILAFAALCQSMVYLFGEGQSWFWLVDYGTVWLKDMSTWAQTGSMSEIHQATRVLILLVGWILLILSVQLLAVNRYTVLLFLVISGVYLFAFELTAGINMFWPITRAFGCGLLLQFSIVFFRHSAAKTAADIEWFSSNMRLSGGSGGAWERLLSGQLDHNSKSGNEGSHFVRRAASSPGFIFSIGSLIVLVSVSAAAAAALLLPVKSAEALSLQQMFNSLEAWADSQHIESSSAAVTGYEGNDQELGQPLHLRRDVYFTAESPERTYWRGQTLSYYDGRGWSDPEGATADAVPAAAFAQEEEKTDDSAERITQKITFAEPQFGKVPLFSGGDLTKVEKVHFDKSVADEAEAFTFTLLQDQTTEAAYLKPTLKGEGLSGYEVESLIKPDPTRGQTREQEQVLAASSAALSSSLDPAEIRYRYLQLPAALPQSVRDLGQSIIAGDSNRYAAAEAVENYLQQNYTYSLESSVPAAGHDFVEDFLFRQRAGYCDHFSTAMVVLLRSQGIPARWVKGYAPGEQTSANQYTVRYSDAHAWVEVYVPGQGWVSFDPTPGVVEVQSAEVVNNTSNQGSGGQFSAVQEHWNQFMNRVLAIFAAGVVKLVHVKELLPKAAQFAVFAAAASFLVGFAAVFGVLMRKAQMNQTGDSNPSAGKMSAWSKHFPGKAELLRSADKAWAGLHRRYGKLATGATVREYTEALDPVLNEEGKAEMAAFLNIWEPLYYGGELPDRKNTRKFLNTCRKWASL